MPTWSEERYRKCCEDMDVARNKIAEMRLLPEECVAEFYCIPSHNHHAYYVVVSEKEGKSYVSYAKSIMYGFCGLGPIYMYPFIDCLKADEHPAKQGGVVVGTKGSSSCLDQIIEELEFLPERYRFDKDEGCWIDGVVQGVRLYRDGCLEKEMFYQDARSIPRLEQKERALLETLYEEIEEILE